MPTVIERSYMKQGYRLREGLTREMIEDGPPTGPSRTSSFPSQARLAETWPVDLLPGRNDAVALSPIAVIVGFADDRRAKPPPCATALNHAGGVAGMRIKSLAALGGYALVFSGPALGQPMKPAKPLFAADDKIHIAIQAPLQTLIRNRNYTGSIPGTLTDPGGLSLPISLSLRGHVNRTTDVCEFPPLRVEFTVPPPPISVFVRQRKLKLVTHCQNNPSNQQHILLDYAAYRIYNLLTPHSFRARLADVDYRDDGRPIISRVGFFIEDEGDVAKRNGLREVKAPQPRIPVEALAPSDAARYALFEHMIGNHDWSMSAGPAGENCCHNAKLIGVLATGATIPVPYDFDFSGLVDSPYATVPDQLHIGSVRERVYRGYCIHNPQVIAVAAEMRAEKPAILNVLNRIPGLDDQMRAKAVGYLEGFFAQIGTDGDTSERVLKRCVR